MSTKSTNASPRTIAVHCEPATFRVSPFGFHRYAAEFLVAAEMFPRSEGFSPVPYYLYCHSLELALKAFILGKGASVVEVKNKFSHNLDALLQRARLDGLDELVPISSKQEEEIRKANAYYKSKGFEYFQLARAARAFPDLPDLAILNEVASSLVAKLRQFCLDVE